MRKPKTILCPKCRALGLTTDCTDQLSVDDMADDDYVLEVTFTFEVPVTSTLVKDPHEMAVHMQESWMNDDAQMREVLNEAVETEYDLAVKPVFG